MSTEATFRDTSDKAELFETVDNLSAELANDLLQEGLNFMSHNSYQNSQLRLPNTVYLCIQIKLRFNYK